MRRGLLAFVLLLVGCNGLSLKRTDSAPVRDALKSALRLHVPSDSTTKYLAKRDIAISWAFNAHDAVEKIKDDQSLDGRIARAELFDLAGRQCEVWSNQRPPIAISTRPIIRHSCSPSRRSDSIRRDDCRRCKSTTTRWSDSCDAARAAS